jgi:hypothetical protein
VSHPSPEFLRAALPGHGQVWYRRIGHLWLRYQWPVLIGAALLGMVLGYVGFRQYYQHYPERPATPGDLLYYTTQLVPMISGGLDHPVSWELEVARHVLPLVVGYAGLAAIIVLMAQPLRRLRLARIRNHVVVCGLGRKGLLLARRFRELGLTVIAIERDPGSRAIEPCRDAGIVVLIGDACDLPLLAKAGIMRARYLVAVCGEDGSNVDIAFAVQNLLEQAPIGRRTTELTCAAHIANPQLRELLQARELELSTRSFRLELFSIFDLGARAMLNEYPVPADGAAATPLVILIGIGQFGGGLLAHAAREWRPRWRETGEKLRVMVVDRRAAARTRAMMARYARLSTVCEITPVDLDVTSAEFHSAAFLTEREVPQEHDQALVTYVCLDQDALALETSLSLLQRLRARRLRVVVRLGTATGLAAFASETRKLATGEARLFGFPLLERTCTPNIVMGGVHETLARAIHDDYRAMRRASGTLDATDAAARPWEELPRVLADANRHQADHIGVKLAAVGCGLAPLNDWDDAEIVFSQEEIEHLARLEHQRWVDDYQAQGWRFAAGEKNPTRKTHPSLLPWELLADEEREKDREAMRALPRFLARAGLQVHRLEQRPGTGTPAAPAVTADLVSRE